MERRGAWIVAGAVVLAGVIVSATLVVLHAPGTASAERVSLKATMSPVEAQRASQDRLAQSNLRNSLAAAKVLFTDTDDYSGVTTTSMSATEPSLFYVDGEAASGGDPQISIWTGTTVRGVDTFAAAALSRSGTCYYIEDAATVGTTYGFSDSAEACTGARAAIAATDPSWPGDSGE